MIGRAETARWRPDFATDGARLHPGAAAALLLDLSRLAASLPPEQAGVRVTTIGDIQGALDAPGAVGMLAAAYLGAACRPVRAILFNKTAATNWAVGWHQDRVIACRERRAVPGYGPWTRKHGVPHVQPPFELIKRMTTLRIHLDPVGLDNAPLLIAPGSHRAGLVPVGAIDRVVQQLGSRACHADAGDVWLYATPILHASPRANCPARRRVAGRFLGRQPTGRARMGVPLSD